MLNEQAKENLDVAQATDSKTLNEEAELDETRKGNWREAFRTAFEGARRQQKPGAGRQELSRDKSKALFLLVGAGAVLLLLFFGIFSSPRKRSPLPGETPRGQASLGRKVTPGQENNDPTKTVTPILSADVRSPDPAVGGRVTPEEVGRTSRTGTVVSVPITNSSTAKPNYTQDYALGKVDFSDPLVGQGSTSPSPPPAPAPEPPSTANQSADLKKPSLVFVRSVETRPAIRPRTSEEDETLALPAGTRLVARLQAPVSSAVDTPAVAVVEYNYERNGQILLPAGAKVFGRLAQVNPSGYVGIQFNRVEMPDGTTEKIDASAMDLKFGPLKGYVSGKKTGTKFLVRSLTGLGTVASYLVGQGSSSAGLISTNALLRERLANNIATAGQEELNGLAFGQSLVVTVPGNTRFYIVVQKPTSDHVGTNSSTRNAASANAVGLSGGVPTFEELRQLIQLRREINELYAQGTSQPVTQTQPQQ